MATIEGKEAVSLGSIRLEPCGINLGATGISSAYDDGYPPELEGWMPQEDWRECMGRINNALMDRFPCGLCRLQAYCCCPCTLGLSLLSTWRQAKEVERGVGEVISAVNENLAARGRGVRFGFRRAWCRAWVQVEYGSSISSSSLVPAPPAAAAESGESATRPRDSSDGDSRRSSDFKRPERSKLISREAMSGATHRDEPFGEEPLLEPGVDSAK